MRRSSARARGRDAATAARQVSPPVTEHSDCRSHRRTPRSASRARPPARTSRAHSAAASIHSEVAVCPPLPPPSPPPRPRLARPSVGIPRTWASLSVSATRRRWTSRCSVAKLRCVTPLEQRCRETLEGSWSVGERDGVPFAYTRPSPGRYRWQWYWDSCFAAIAWRHFDPARSRAELETLLAAARPDGFIGHTIFWEHPVSGPRRLFYNVIHHDDVMTATIEPPALAFAWRMAVGDPALEPRIVAHHAAVSDQRDLEGDGLLWILQPDESGLDASPQFDPIWRDGRRACPASSSWCSAIASAGFGSMRCAPTVTRSSARC